MKVLIVLTLIFVVASATKDVNELKSIAKTLLEKANIELRDIQKIRRDFQNLADKANEQDGNIDQEISKDNHIKEIEESLKGLASNKNVDVCKNLYNEKRQALKQKLQRVFAEELTIHARDYENSTHYVENELSAISANLQGANLDNEINVCTSSETCNLTGDYSIKININEEVIKNFERHARLAVQFVLITKINWRLANQIDNEVYNPVYNCIQRL